MKSTETLLRNTLKSNAIFSFISGLLLAIFSSGIGQFMQVAMPGILMYIGIGLIFFAGLVFFNGFKTAIDQNQVKFIILQDWIWVAGSLIIIIANPFSISLKGNLLIGFVAGVVAVFAMLQTKGLRHINQKAEV